MTSQSTPPTPPTPPARSGRGGRGPASPLTLPFRLLGFAAWYVGALLRSYASLVADVLTPGLGSTPGFVRLPTDCRRETEVALLGALISLTPGTLAFGARRATAADGRPADDERWVLYVHGMYSEDAPTLRQELHEMEHRMLAAVRPHGFAP